MTTKYLLKTPLLLAVSLVVVGCSNSYPGETYDLVKDPSISNNESELSASSRVPIKMFINEQDFFTVSASPTRGYGPFELDETKKDRFWNSYFYVFAFRSVNYSQGTSMPELREPANFARTAYAKDAPSQSLMDPNNAHCLLDGNRYALGVPMRISYTGSGQLKNYVDESTQTPDVWGSLRDSVYYYNPLYQDVPYNFFCYHIDKLPDNLRVQRMQDYICYDNFEIDGTQDVMVGEAPSLDSLIMNNLYGTNNPIANLSTADKLRLLGIGGYSAFAAHRDIHPEIKLYHQLTCLEFFAYPGDESADDITIDSIKVESFYKGKLVVATNNKAEQPLGFQWSSEKKALSLREKAAYDDDGLLEECRPLKQDYYTVHYKVSEKDSAWQHRTRTQVGGGLMLAPSPTFFLHLYYRQRMPGTYSNPGGVARQAEARYEISLSNGRPFEAGRIYPVHIAVFGLQDIQVTTNVQGWERDNSGGAIVDPDNELFDD